MSKARFFIVESDGTIVGGANKREDAQRIVVTGQRLITLTEVEADMLGDLAQVLASVKAVNAESNDEMAEEERILQALFDKLNQRINERMRSN